MFRMYASTYHSYTHLILALGVVREPTVWGFNTSEYPGIHDIGLPTYIRTRSCYKRCILSSDDTYPILYPIYPLSNLPVSSIVGSGRGNGVSLGSKAGYSVGSKVGIYIIRHICYSLCLAWVIKHHTAGLRHLHPPPHGCGLVRRRARPSPRALPRGRAPASPPRQVGRASSARAHTGVRTFESLGVGGEHTQIIITL